MADLKTGELYWNAIHPKHFEAQRLDRDIRCDALIIGSGITGAFIAYQLAAQGIDAAVVDRREIAQGSTPASTALIQYEIDITLAELAKKRGIGIARQAYSACHRAVGEIEELSKKLGLDESTKRRGSIYLASKGKHEELLRKEAIRRRVCGIECEFLDRARLMEQYRLDRPCALFSQRAMEIDPVALTYALHESARQAGVKYFQETEVSLVSTGESGARLRAKHGPEIAAGKVIFASGYEIPRVLKRKICTYRSTYALATQPIGEDEFWPGRCLIWEHADPYLYARSTADNRILLGGEDVEDFDPDVRDDHIERKTAALLKKGRLLFPWLRLEAAFQWAGTFAVTDDGLPYIGGLAELPGCQFALGYGGNGITFGYLASQIIRDNFVHCRNSIEHLFSFGRHRSA